MLQENCLRIMCKQWEAYSSDLNKRRPLVAHDMRSTDYRQKQHSTLDEKRAQQRRRWRLLMDPAFKKRFERGARRRRARDDRLNAFLRVHSYRTASYRFVSCAPTLSWMTSSKFRGGGLERASSVDEERASIRFVCFPCLLSTMEDEPIAVKTKRIENEKSKHATNAC